MTSKVECGMKAGFRMQLELLDDIVMPTGVINNIKSMKTRSVRDDDIILCTFPKSGTHWVWEIMNMLTVGKPVYAKHWQNSSFMESLSIEEMEALPSPRILFTHLHPTYLSPDYWKRKCHVVNVIRNPKDAVLSFYYQHKNQNWVDKSRDGAFAGSFADYVDAHLTGSVPFGSVIEHWVAWNKFHDDHPSVPFSKVQYEDLKKDDVKQIRRLANFINCPLPDSVYKEIAEACRFDKLKYASENIKDQTYYNRWREGSSGYFRKGVVGDWKTMFTVAQSERFDQLYKKTFKQDFPY